MSYVCVCVCVYSRGSRIEVETATYWTLLQCLEIRLSGTCNVKARLFFKIFYFNYVSVTVVCLLACF